MRSMRKKTLRGSVFADVGKERSDAKEPTGDEKIPIPLPEIHPCGLVKSLRGEICFAGKISLDGWWGDFISP